MPSETVDQEQTRCPATSKGLNQLAPPQTEAIPCPRCDSSNTKFCYYNNYNLSQPRHFCKSCRRYWTHGGTLRDVPVGGGSRKNTKRSRSSPSSSAIAATSSSSSSSSSAPKPVVSNQPAVKAEEQGSDHPNPNPSECGIGFTSLLNSQALGGGGFGLEEIAGFGYVAAKAVWPFHEAGDFGVGNTWQINTGSEGGLVDGSASSASVDCFAWPDLSISMPGGNGLK